MLSQVGDALNDCDKILEVVEMSKKIIHMQLERVDIFLFGRCRASLC